MGAMKLWVRHIGSRKNLPFRPTLRIQNDPYSRNHWQEGHFKPGAFCGAGVFPEISLKQAMEIYFSELRRMKYEDVSADIG